MSDIDKVNVVCPKCENQEMHSYRGPYKDTATCEECSTKFSYVFAKTRAKKSRGSRKDDSREFDIRVYLNDGSEKFIQFKKSGWDDIELRSKDLVVFSFLGDDVRIVQNVGINSYTVISKPSCFIATYLYGPYSSEVVFLRDWRDKQLIPSYLGAILVSCYYTVSPILLRYAGGSFLFKKMAYFAVRFILRGLGYKNVIERNRGQTTI